MEVLPVEIRYWYGGDDVAMCGPVRNYFNKFKAVETALKSKVRGSDLKLQITGHPSPEPTGHFDVDAVLPDGSRRRIHSKKADDDWLVGDKLTEAVEELKKIAAEAKAQQG
eukprot:jgi/Mesvir1/26947/Mv24241-RA.1